MRTERLICLIYAINMLKTVHMACSYIESTLNKSVNLGIFRNIYTILLQRWYVCSALQCLLFVCEYAPGTRCNIADSAGSQRVRTREMQRWSWHWCSVCVRKILIKKIIILHAITWTWEQGDAVYQNKSKDLSDEPQNSFNSVRKGLLPNNIKMF